MSQFAHHDTNTASIDVSSHSTYDSKLILQILCQIWVRLLCNNVIDMYFRNSIYGEL